MPRNRKDFDTCPECYGLGETYHGTEDDPHRDTCYTCNPQDKTTPKMERARENAAEDASAKAEADRGK